MRIAIVSCLFLVALYSTGVNALERAPATASGHILLHDAVEAFRHQALDRGALIRVLERDLNASDWQSRIEAIVATTDTRTTELSDTLWTLTDERLWPVAYSAFRALSILGGAQAQPSLDALAAGHWALTVRSLVDVGHSSAPESANNMAFHDDSWIRALQDATQLPEAYACEGNEYRWKGRWHLLKDMRVFPLPDRRRDLPSFRLPATGGRVAGEFDANSEFLRTNTVATAVRDGWLVGSDWGEFGGVLLFLSGKGKPTIIEEGQFDGLYKTRLGLLASSGVNHLMSSPGEFRAVVATGPTRWRTRLINMTEIADGMHTVTDDGTLIVKDLGGMLALTDGGKWERLMCR